MFATPIEPFFDNIEQFECCLSGRRRTREMPSALCVSVFVGQRVGRGPLASPRSRGWHRCPWALSPFQRKPNQAVPTSGGRPQNRVRGGSLITGVCYPNRNPERLIGGTWSRSNTAQAFDIKRGAGEGNRTLVISLEGCCSSDPGGTYMKRSLESFLLNLVATG